VKTKIFTTFWGNNSVTTIRVDISTVHFDAEFSWQTRSVSWRQQILAPMQWSLIWENAV